MRTNAMIPDKKLFIVLGFARSGTSVITRGLKALGIDLGDNLVPHHPTCQWNPTGFFEDKEIVYKINSKVFEILGYEERGIQLIDNKLILSDRLNEVRSSAILLLKQRFTTTKNWAFKDPHAAKILPFWQSICQELHLTDNYIIALRNPLSIAQSYSDLTKSDFELGLILWLMHLLPAIEQTHPKKRIIVSYEYMMQNPRFQLQRISDKLDLSSTANPAEIDIFVNSFLDKKLQRNKYQDEDLKTHPAVDVAPLCLRAYDLFLKLARDEVTFDSQEFLESWQQIKKELEHIYPIYCYLDRILKRNKQLKRTIQATNKSLFWKMLYPLRLIDDSLRSRRREKRKEKRIQTAYE